MRGRLAFALGSFALLSSACSEAPADVPAPEPAPSVAPTHVADAARGRALMAHFECARCHDGTGQPDEPEERSCVGCHRSIRAGTFDAPAAQQRRWAESLVSLNHAPSLEGLAGHLRADWIADFLRAPHDVRPGLLASMPRLRIDAAQAADMAAALTEGAAGSDVEVAPAGDPRAGLRLLEERGCLSCHAFGGAVDESSEATRPTNTNDAARQLAPDLRHTRARMTRASLMRWLRAPSEVRPDTPMPTPALTETERADVASALLDAALAPASQPAIPDRLPVLERRVRFDEVADRVLSRTCWHCHADPDFAQGDGGAGNTGGFGFEGRGVSLIDYAGVSSGYLADDGERRSLFAEDEDGTPHLIRVLMARHAEVAGAPIDGIVGMPLGLPPVSVEDIQLVETWIAQGRAR